MVGFGIGESQDGMGAEPGNAQRGHAAGNAEQKAFGENLANDSGAGSAKRHAHRNIRALRGGSGQQQAGDVGARDQAALRRKGS